MVAGAALPAETADDNPFKVATVAVNAELLAFLVAGQVDGVVELLAGEDVRHSYLPKRNASG